MANKRTASTNLNHDNWDEEEEPEPSGKFQTAQASVIASRKIKLATRRLKNSMDVAPALSEKTPTESIFHSLGVNFASPWPGTSKTTLLSRPTEYKPKPALSNTNEGPPNAPQPDSTGEPKIVVNKRSKQDKVRSDEEPPGTSAFSFRPMNTANSPSTFSFRLPPASGSKSTVDSTSVEKPLVSSNKNEWHITPPQPTNQESAPSIMPCFVAESKSCAPSMMNTEILAKKDSRHLLKPVPDDVLARLKAKSESTAKSLNFLKRTYQLNMTTLDWLHILIGESLTVNIAEVIPSYMHELLKLIEEEIACQQSNDAKQQLIPHKNQLQQMMGIFRQFGFLAGDENSSKSETLPESANKPSSNLPMRTNKLESSPQSSNSLVTNKDNTLKMKSTNQEVKQTLNNVQNEPHSMTSSGNHGSEQQASDETENGDGEPSEVDSYTPVVEEGSICTMRCKVFVKKVVNPSDPPDTPYQNRGVGSLFVKPIAPGKLQLVVRADNSLGNVILNTCITPEIPVEIANSNTLMLVCCPMPGEIARTVLIRVKNKVHVDLLHVSLATI